MLEKTEKALSKSPLAGVVATAMKAIGAAGAILWCHPATAQESPTIPEAPRYTVELIVFTYSDPGSAGNEIFVPDKPQFVPDTDEAEQPGDAERVFSDVPLDGEEVSPVPEDLDSELEEGPERQRIELQVLDPDEHSMRDIHATLERLDAYVPILHTAWTQSTPARDVSPAIHLRALGDLPPGLDGSLTLYLGRYLHLVVDLALDAEPRQQSMTATDRLVAYGDEGGYRGQSEADNGFGDFRDRSVRYRIVEDRIMRTGDLRYFDHPRFGVIAKVTKPADDPQESNTAPSASADP